jgi:hypothetical protein
VISRPPHRPFKDAQVLNDILRKAYDKTGLKPPAPYVGTHSFRHNLATNLVQNGASLEEISDALRIAPARRQYSTQGSMWKACALSRSRGRPGRCGMSALSRELNRYLAIRRGLGFELRTDERVLRRFIGYAERTGAEYVSAEIFIGWRESFGDANQHTWSRRLGIVRIFAQWLHGIDPRHQVPSRDLIPSRQRRSRP